jgi:transposase
MATKVWVGVDWGVGKNQVCVIDGRREVVDELEVENTGQGLLALVRRLVEHGEPSEMAAAIETPRAAVIDALTDLGVAVYVINPKQLDRFRDRFTVAGAKDDRRDARVLADALHTDAKAFRRIEPSSAHVIALRELTRMREDLSKEHLMLANRLRDLLARYYVQILEIGSVHRETWLWDLVELAPLPAKARRLRLSTIEALLKAARIRRVSASDVLEKLRARPLPVAEAAAVAYSQHVLALLERLRVAHRQLVDVDRKLEELLDELEASASGGEKSENRDTRVLRSLPGVGPLVGATILVEGTEPLARRDYATLRALGGIAPVTKASGKRSGAMANVAMRRACNQRLRNAIYHWALNALQYDPRAKALYQGQRARGNSHGRSLRAVADRLLAMLIAMLRTGETYDPARRALPAQAA